MQGYGAAFARAYNLLWTEFALNSAPRIFDFYTRNEIAPEQQSLLDVGCGTGQLALYFLERGYHVTGVDLSDAMLDHARQNASMFVQAGQAHFVQADASAFTLDERFGLVVSTYDALNHLSGLDALQSCFASVYAVTQEGGTFIFDLNTRLGLQRWNGITVRESDDSLVIERGIFDGETKAYARVNGFVRDEDGRYTRFEETVYNTVFELEAVRAALLDVGWKEVYFARASDLTVPLDVPENEGRVFVVAKR